MNDKTFPYSFQQHLPILGVIITSLFLSACGGGSDSTSPALVPVSNTQETFIRQISVASYTTQDNDLLTAGFGQDALPTAQPNIFDSIAPRHNEIRSRSIVKAYQSQLDMRSRSGYGSLYGPAVPNLSNGGRVQGTEYSAFLENSQNSAIRVLIPTAFNRFSPCLVAVGTPAYDDVYSAAPVFGEWALKNSCAVVYTDKGAGSGGHDLDNDNVGLIDGLRSSAANAVSKDAQGVPITPVVSRSHFTAQGNSSMTLPSYSSIFPHRVALKQAHSQVNPEKDWGQFMLNSIEGAFEVLNRMDAFGNRTSLNAENTLVIATGLGTGGAAALRAAEQDSTRLIDAVVAAAPLVSPRTTQNFSIRHNRTEVYDSSVLNKSIFEVLAFQNLYQPCVNSSTQLNGKTIGSGARCEFLRDRGIISSNSRSAQINTATQALRQYGILSEALETAPMYLAAEKYVGYVVANANAYGRFSVVDNLCNYSYAAVSTGNQPRALSLSEQASLFFAGTGIAPDNLLKLINNNDNGLHDPAQNYLVSTAQYAEGALCLQRLASGEGLDGTLLNSVEQQRATRVQDGILDILANGNLRGKPAFIVHGRRDPIAHVNFTGRAYYALNKLQNPNSNLVYIEVKHAHHIDALDQTYAQSNHIPLVYYINQALDRLYDHLINRTPLPASQVIASNPGTQLNINQHLPPIDAQNNCEIVLNSNAELVVDFCGELL